ncbi:MAG: cytochrome c [Solirubrobacteraceae bacterium]|nr:cytochrome c [Solirubrobacteraceae bacterium]
MRHAARIAAFAVASSSLLALSACGSEEIGLAKNDPYYKGAAIFSQRCAGCHTLSIAGTQGSSTSAKDKEITDGPNFNQRKETEANVLYALRNGGFSNKIMPQNLVTGSDADEVARFLAKYAGTDVDTPVGPSRKAVDTGSDEVLEDSSDPEEEGASSSEPTTPGDVTTGQESPADASTTP